MTPLELVSLLQISDSMFPVGAFAYSDGLETAASELQVRNGKDLEGWLHHYIYGVFVPADGRALLRASIAFQSKDYAAISQVDDELWALKPSAAVRASSTAIGSRLFAAFAGIRADLELPVLPHNNCAVAYGVVYAACGLTGQEALLAYGYGRLAAIVSAALRLIPVGQQEGQALLAGATELLPLAAGEILASPDEPLRCFNPRLDITQMNHQYVYSRLFRS